MEQIDIKDISGAIQLTTLINEGCKRKFTLMKEDYIMLKFSLENPIYFKLGSYVECNFGLFEVCDLQKPAFNTNTAGYDYELRLDAYYWKWKNKIFKYTPETAGQEASWNLTAPLDVQAGIVLRNLKALGYTYKGQDFVFSIDSTVENKSQLMSYDNINILDACFEMAKKWDCECWVTENIIHFGRCESGDAVDFEIGKNVQEMSQSESQSTYATRIYAFGSTRNIPADYRPIDETVVVNGVVQRRLMLPEGTPYIDAYPDMTTEEAVEQVVIFDEVYPRRTGIMSDVTTIEVTDKVENEDGTTTEEKWNAYRFRDTGVNFSEKYILPGQELRIRFASGLLNGLEFAVKFNPEGKPEKLEDGGWNPEAQLWEIVRNEDYGRPLPGDVLFPQDGDEYVLSGWDSTKITELGLVGAAEQELKEKTEKYAAKSKIDPSTYGCTMMSNDAYREDGVHNFYGIGQKVNLINNAYFENGRQSRVIGFEFNLDLAYDSPIYTVGETAAYSRIGELEKKVESLTLKGQTYTGGGGSGVYVIGSHDSTPATDNNVYSALRSQKEFLSKNRPDTAKESIRFLKGVSFGEAAGGKPCGIVDGEGNAEYLTAVIRELLRSTEFVDGLTGEGWQLWIDQLTGLTNLTVDKVTARQSLVALELLIEKVRSVCGQLVVSAANGKIKDVVKQGDNYRIVFEQESGFVAHDLMRCAVTGGKKLKAYWVEVASVIADGVLVPVSEFGGVKPEAGDECVLMGNTENPLRQNLISIAATEDGQPRIDILDGVKAKNFNGCLRCRLGKLDGIRSSAFPADKQPKGNGLYADNVWLKGTFVLMTGEDILTRFEITEGKIHSAVESLRKEIREEQSYLDNSSFADGMDKWKTGSKATLFTLGGRWIWANGGPYGTKPDGHAEIRTDGKVPYAYIRNSYIMQKLEDFRLVPEYRQTNSQGERVPGVVYLSFSYRVIKAGRLKIEFVNADKTGFENFNMFGHEEDLPVGGEKMFTLDGLWNGTGDFKLSFTGVIYISLLVFSTNKADALAYKYRTLFEQSDRLVKISAAVFDKDGNALKETGLVIKPEGSGLYAQDNTGKIALIGVSVEEEDEYGNTVSKIKLTADHIQLEGLVTANGNFKILEDGSIETTNGKFTGEIDSSKGKIGGFEIGNGRIGSVADSHGSGGGLAIYDDFFRVGGSKGYVMFGDDVIPSSAGGAFTAVGRIVNSAPNIYGNYGFDQANYGLFIDVTGGTKNYGISSNAALLAPAFINTKAKLLTFGSGNYTVDFSQHNIILMYYNEPNYSKVEVTLPSESSVAYKFGMSYLPTDFAAIVTFRVRPGSKNIILKGIYNHNEDLQNYEMASGDSVTVLITKADGFRYQILNHSS